MTRRAHRQFSLKLLVLVFGGFVVLATGGALLLDRFMDPFRTVEKIKPTDYFENANSLRGNVYQVEGVISGSLGWNPGKGRLFSLRLTYEGKDWPVPVLVPSSLQQLNLQKGQKYRAKVRVNESGLLVVEEMDKT